MSSPALLAEKSGENKNIQRFPISEIHNVLRGRITVSKDHRQVWR